MTDIRRLPTGFALNVDPDATADAPADLGDYLDEDPYPTLPRPRKKTKRRGKASARPSNKIVGEIRPGTQTPETTNVDVEPRPAKKPSSRVRKQINMKPDTLAKFDELLHMIRTATQQYDASGAELQRALVSLAWDAREHLEFKLEKRGRHGTGTAETFDAALKQAFGDALRRRLQRT